MYTLTPTSGTRVVRRIDLPCTGAGFQKPPCHVQLRFLPVREGWTLMVRTAPNMSSAVAKWLQETPAARVTVAPGLAPRVVRADFEALPTAWQELLSALRVHHLGITPEGVASVFVEGTVEQVDGLLARLQSESANVRCRATILEPQVPKLTRRQIDALSTAVAMGYYDIPHNLDLRTLAATMGISLGSVSELLRRGESAVIMNYVDSLASAPWDPLEESEWNEAQEATYAPLVTLPNRRTDVEPPLLGRTGVDLVRAERARRAGLDPQVHP
ncbi:MAG TPA: helix-turn-helix domain-containing protein [Candidatus Thermoplasmatota archaeon]|nr:helix-turn-helix domain-containing protein [Candidatus Thermoplasmatota archaeon]